jgi:cell wall assembly regulator SMI1
MKQIWDRIERWAETTKPVARLELAPAAAANSIAALEAAIGQSLPADYKRSLAVHDGQNDKDNDGLTPIGHLLSVARSLDEWRIWKDLLDGGEFENSRSKPDEGVRDDWWNPGWIPITHDGGGNHICLDLNPAPGGTRGQLITMIHDDCPRERLALSFADYFAAIADGLETGKLALDGEMGWIMPIDEA